MRISLPLRTHGFALALLPVLAGVLFALALPSGARAAETCPNEQLRRESNLNQVTGQPHSTELPDCRAYELVSPVEKGQANINPEGGGAAGQKPFEQAADDGEGILYGSIDALPETESGPYAEEMLGFRGGEAWSTLPLTGPQLLEEREGSWVNVFAYLSPNLTCGTDETEEPMEVGADGEPSALPAGESLGEVINLYAWSKASNAYTLVTNTDPANRLGLTGVVPLPYHIYGANEDCSRVVFATEYKLLPSAPATGDGLYEWDEGALSLISLRPDKTVGAVTNYGAGLQEASLFGAISEGAQRIFFTTTSDSGSESGKSEVFMREGGTTTEISKSATATADAGAEFQAASSDGSQVFFTANYKLTSQSSSGLTTCTFTSGHGCDLYDYDVEPHALTDLTPDGNLSDSEGADVMGVLGISDDGSYVYFAALGQLQPGKGKTEAENKAGKLANVYLWHDGAIAYVATVSESDVTNVANDLLNHSGELGSRVTPDGRYLLFTSNYEVTGYDNRNSEGHATEQLYLFSSAGDKVVCVSCDPDGAPPTQLGDAVTSDPGFNHAYAPHNLSEDGDQIFFTGGSPLAPGATAGNNGYEWEREGTGDCTEAEAHEAAEYSGGCIYLLAPGGTVLDASPNGEDVFLTTRFPMVAQDKDGSNDVYDARVDGGYPAPTVARCSGEACQGEAGEGLSFATPGSLAPPAIGNAAPTSKPKPSTRAGTKAATNAQKLAKALKQCAKRPKKKRAVCRRRARMRYGKHHGGKRKAHSKKSAFEGGK